MKAEPDDDGIIDGAILAEAQRPDTRQQIAELIMDSGRLAMIKNRGNYFTVHFMVKSSGAPQWNIDFWVEERTSVITDTMAHGRSLAEAFTRGSDQTNGGRSSQQK